MNPFAEIMSIEVGMRGVETVKSGLEKIEKAFGVTEGSVAGLEAGLLSLAVAFGLVFGGIREQMETQHYQAMFEGLTGSAEEAQRNLEAVDRIASKGVFSEKDAFVAIENMDRYGVSVSKNIDLVEKLGARSGNLGSAANLIGIIEAGYTNGLGRRLKEFGLGPERLRKAGLNVEGSEIKGSSQEIIAALEKIAKTDKTLDKLMNTAQSGVQRLMYQFSELVETIGTPFIGPLQSVLGVVTEIFRWIKDLNIITDGWVGKLVVGGLLFNGLLKIVGFLREIVTLEKLIAFWSGIRSVLQAGPTIVEGFGKIVSFLRSMLTIETLLAGVETVRAFLAAAIAWALGNKAGAIGAIALIAAAGIGIGAAIQGINNYRSEQEKRDSEKSSGKRPVRRDDIERIYKRMYGDAWTG